MLAAFAPRRFGVQERLLLARVQMPPLALRLMVVELAGSPAFRAGPIVHVVVSQANVNLALLQRPQKKLSPDGQISSTSHDSAQSSRMSARSRFT